MTKEDASHAQFGLKLNEYKYATSDWRAWITNFYWSSSATTDESSLRSPSRKLFAPPPHYRLGSLSSIYTSNSFSVDKSSSTYVRTISFSIINHNETLLPKALIRTYLQCTGSMYTLKVRRWRESACIGWMGVGGWGGFYGTTSRASRRSWHLVDTYLIASSYLPIYLRSLSSLWPRFRNVVCDEKGMRVRGSRNYFPRPNFRDKRLLYWW